MLLHFVLVLHFAAIVVTFCVSITFCCDYYILRRNKPKQIYIVIFQRIFVKHSPTAATRSSSVCFLASLCRAKKQPSLVDSKCFFLIQILELLKDVRRFNFELSNVEI